jgi:hypothetical protein
LASSPTTQAKLILKIYFFAAPINSWQQLLEDEVIKEVKIRQQLSMNTIFLGMLNPYFGSDLIIE